MLSYCCSINSPDCEINIMKKGEAIAINYWHPISEPHPNGRADGVEVMDVSGRIYQAAGEVILDGTTVQKPITPAAKVLAWRVAIDGSN